MYLSQNKIFTARAIAECLAAGHLLNKSIHGNLLAEILIHATGIDRKSISTTDISKAFKGDGYDEYMIRFDCIELDLDLSKFPNVGRDDVLLVQRQRRDYGSNKRYLVVGRFESEQAAKAAKEDEIVTQMQITKTDHFPLSDRTKVRLVEKIENKRVYNKVTVKKESG